MGDRSRQRARPSRRVGVIPGRRRDRGDRRQRRSSSTTPTWPPNAWTNFAEDPGNGVDDDGNGYVDDVHGVAHHWPARARTASTARATAPTARASSRPPLNGCGVGGVAPRVRMMPLKFLGADGKGTLGAGRGHRLRGRQRRARDQLSIQGRRRRPAPGPPVARRGRHARVLVSAGNSARDIDAQAVYPAAILAPNLIAVAATAPEEGARWRALQLRPRRRASSPRPAARSSAIQRRQLEDKSGTSMAAPQVTGAPR